MSIFFWINTVNTVWLLNDSSEDKICTKFCCKQYQTTKFIYRFEEKKKSYFARCLNETQLNSFSLIYESWITICSRSSFFFAAFYHISYRKIKSVLSNAHYNSDVLTRAQYAIIVFAYSNVYVNFRLRFSFCRWCMTLFFIRLVSVYEIGLCMSCCNASTFTKSLKQLEFFFLFGLLKLALPLCCSIEMVMPK